MNAILYARFSPRPNAAECESVANQLAACREHCQSAGYVVSGEYSDEAMSGADAERPGLWAAVDALKRGDVLVCWKLDRLARDVYLAETIHRQVEKIGAKIEFVTGGGDEDTPEGELIRRILQAFSEYERKIIAIRTSFAMKRHQSNGRRMGGHCPYGWMSDPDNPARMVECPDEQAAIKRIHQLRGIGLGLRAIALYLDTQGYKPRGKSWRPSTVAKILDR